MIIFSDCVEYAIANKNEFKDYNKEKPNNGETVLAIFVDDPDDAFQFAHGRMDCFSCALFRYGVDSIPTIDKIKKWISVEHLNEGIS